MEIALLLWIPLCGLVGWLASQKGRSGIGFFFLAFFLSPLIGILAVIAVPSRIGPAASAPVRPNDLLLCTRCGRPGRADAKSCAHCGAKRGEAPDPLAGLKKCPSCAEMIKSEAIKCRFCGTEQILAPTPMAHVLAGGMGHCPGCRKLRHSSVAKCVYCGNTDTVPVEESK